MWPGAQLGRRRTTKTKVGAHSVRPSLWGARCAFLPVRRRHLALPQHHGLTGHPLVLGEAARAGEARLHARRGGKVLRAGDDAYLAARADADAAAGVAEGDAGAASHVEERLVALRLGGPGQRGERHAHATFSPETFARDRRLCR